MAVLVAAAGSLARGAAPRVSRDVHRLDRLDRVVALDDQFAALRLAASLVPDDHAETAAGRQDGWERITRQRQVAALPAESDAADVQGAGTDVADGDGRLRASAAFRARTRRAQTGRVGDREPSGQRLAGHRHLLRAGRVGAV